MEKRENAAEQPSGSRIKYLSPLGAWALSFGCAVGWGSFIMPGTTFLPLAGPLGTALGMGVGVVIMLIIGMNYHFLMDRYPSAGGTLTYATKAFGYDHGFLSSWFLFLVYVAIMWANASALILVFRNLLGDVFQFGFHYQILGYDVYMGEVLLTMAATVLVCGICIRGKRLAVGLQILLALVLLVGIVVAFIAVMRTHREQGASLSPAFAPSGVSPVLQVLQIVVLSPWAFVGFESVSHSVVGFRFSTKKTIWVFVAALLTSGAAYILLTLMAGALQPAGYDSWPAYVRDLGALSGVEAMPTFFATESAFGTAGSVILLITLLGGVLTGLIGNLIAASRLICAMAADDILPKWFGKLNRQGSPRNAILFLMALSLVIPFFGRTAIGWIVDMTTIGAVIAYGYTSAAALRIARQEKKTGRIVTGAVGLAVSVAFFLYFMVSTGSMATESYFILILWSILGFIFFRFVFRKDRQRRFGKSTVVWIGLLFLIFFTSLMWMRQATNRQTETMISNITAYYEEQHPQDDWDHIQEAEQYMEEQLVEADRAMTTNSFVQMGLIVASLAIMLSVYSTMSRREKQAEAERVQAEANREIAEKSSKAKTTFLFNMSHDIRTPMNAIIGYTTLAKKEQDPEVIRNYLTKIDSSSQHLLALINDVLEMSRIESGKMDLEPVNMDLRETLAEVQDMFSTQMETKGIDFYVDAGQIKDPYVVCDKNRFNRVLLNLVSNAYKFTPAGGTVSIALYEIGDPVDGASRYELRVKDSGIGMSKEFAATVFEAFTREKTSTVSRTQGTGLGMAITKSIVDLMGGTIEVETAPNMGTEFIIRLTLPLQSAEDIAARKEPGTASEEAATDFTGKRLLLAEDNDINREIATMILEEYGFTVEAAEDGLQAVEKVKASRPGDYDLVLMDIQMPGMDGYEATRAIRGLADPALAKIPIIAMTANAFAEDVKAARDAGMDGHIAKPLDIQKMLVTLTEILRDHAGR